MAARPAIDETPSAQHARCAILLTIAECWPTRARFASAMGVADNTLSQWLSGVRPFGWPVLYGAMGRAAALYPQEMPRILGLLGEHVGYACRVGPLEADSSGGDWADELADHAEVDAEIHAAVRAGDAAALREAGERKRRETEQLVTAGLAEIERRGPGALRVAR